MPRPKSSSNMTYSQREQIEQMLKNNMPVSLIAKKTGLHRATVYRELKRCAPGCYSADDAQKSIYSK